MDNSNNEANAELNMEVVGYKRKFSEIFKLPNLVKGDMLSEGYYVTRGDPLDASKYISNQKIEPNDTYQFSKHH